MDLVVFVFVFKGIFCIGACSSITAIMAFIKSLKCSLNTLDVKSQVGTKLI